MRESEGFDAFYAGTSRRIVGQVFAMVGDLPEAEDAVQEAYARAWQKWRKIEHYADPESWVRTVAYRIAVSSWRKSGNRLRAQQRHGALADVPGIGPDQLALIAALRRIPRDQRHAIVLHHLAGLTVEEISREVSAPAGTVKARLARGRRALAPHINEFADDGVTARLGEVPDNV